MRQRLQIARNLVTEPRLVFMDEPTGGLDVSVQARLLDLMRNLVSELGLAAIVVTHDLAVARLLSHRVMVMKGGQVIETGLTDQVLDDPHEPYTQLLDRLRFCHHEARPMPAMIEITDAEKTFTMHLQGGVKLPVVRGVNFVVDAGECVVLAGPSGAGKSSILKMIFGNYRFAMAARSAFAMAARCSILPKPSRVTCSTFGAIPSVMSASFCARCRACRPSMWSPSR